MKTIRLFIYLVIAGLLSGCGGLMVTKDTASTFETWELCTLLYRPTTMYENWYVDPEENGNIRAELGVRGITSEKECTLSELAKKQCVDYGFQVGTNEYAKCRQDAEQYIMASTRAVNMKNEQERKDAAEAWDKAFEAGKKDAAVETATTCTKLGREVRCTSIER